MLPAPVPSGRSWRHPRFGVASTTGQGATPGRCRPRPAAATAARGPRADLLTLGPGDYARYGADRPHVYRSADADCHGILLVGYPPA